MTIIKKLGQLAGAFSLLATVGQPLFSQEQIGMRTERYAGIYGATINPAHTSFMPHPWEISLFSFDAFANNRYAYLANTSFPKALRHSEDITYIGDVAPGESRPGAIYQHFFEPGGRIHGVGQFRGGGPALAFHLGPSFTVGLLGNVRFLASSYGIPETLAFANLENLPRFEPRQVRPLAFAGMGWAELGLNLGYRFDNGEGLSTSIGITPKMLLGFEGVYANSSDALSFTKLPRDTLYFSNADLDYGLSFADVVGDSVPDYDPFRRSGRGVGLDLGIAWSMEDDDSESPNDYLWRAGVSLLDLGGVRFNQHSVAYQMRSDSGITLPPDLWDSPSNVDEFTGQLAGAFGSSLPQSFKADHFQIGLPTALSLQVDYRVRPFLYLSGLWIQRLPLGKNALKRPNTLAITPRFEHKWVSLSLPVVLSDWRSPRLGLAARLAWLYLGTDNLPSLIGQQKLSGADLYVGLKVNGFSFGRLSLPRLKGGGGGGSRQKRGKIKCYNF